MGPYLQARLRGARQRAQLEALEHRAHEGPNHVTQKAAASIVGAARRRAPPGRRGRCRVDGVLRLGRREGGEIVRAGQQQRRAPKRLEVERARPPERTALGEGRTHPPAQHPVAVTPCARRETGAEALRRHLARTTATSGGSAALSAAVARSGGGPSAAVKDATCAVACTPVSVRPATARPAQAGKTASSASRRTPSLVRLPGWRAQPRNPVPSYSRVSFRMVSATRPYAGSTTSRRPSTSLTTTRSPTSAPTSQRACQISPATRTCPIGLQSTETTADARQALRCRPWPSAASTTRKKNSVSADLEHDADTDRDPAPRLLEHEDRQQERDQEDHGLIGDALMGSL